MVECVLRVAEGVDRKLIDLRHSVANLQACLLAGRIFSQASDHIRFVDTEHNAELIRRWVALHDS